MLNETAGSLALESLAGETVAVFPRGSTVDSVEWSPDNRYVLFWHGMLSASVLADGLALWMLDTESGLRAVGYYGQSRWDDLLAYRPDAPRAPVPPLTETYTDPTGGFTLSYPAGWYTGEGWRSLRGWQAAITLSPSPPDGPVPKLGPFSGRVFIAVRGVNVPEGTLDALLEQMLASSGPGQILERDRVLTPFDQRELTVAGRPAVRLETMGDFGVVNHVLVVLGGERGIVLRGRGDGRVFDAVAKSLRWLDSR